MEHIHDKKWDKHVNACIQDSFLKDDVKDKLNISNAIDTLITAMKACTGNLNYKLAGGCKGIPINFGTFDEVLKDCKRNKVSYIIEGLQSIPGYYNELAQSLSNKYLANISVNAFISCQDSRPSPLHYDFHDLVNVQLIGEKYWNVYRRAKSVDYSPEGYKINAESSNDCVYSGAIEEGEVFSIPKGFAHDVSTTSDISLHLAIGIRFMPLKNIIINKIEKQLPLELERPIWNGNTSLNSIKNRLHTDCSIDLQPSLDDILQFSLASQKLWITSEKEKEISIAKFDKGAFFVDYLEDKIVVYAPMIVHSSIDIDKNSFKPSFIELPLELTDLIKQIETEALVELNIDQFGLDTSTIVEVVNIFDQLGLVSYS